MNENEMNDMSSSHAYEYLYSPGNPVATKKGKKKQTHKLN